ncbi:MAG TPA: FxsA family protein [Frankiaceae bacterium]|nr:FxsA family protein [Frankiaceae bacterium]
MPALLLVLFIVVPIVELWAIIQVGSWLGVLPTIGLLLLSAILGTWLVKREGAKVWRAFRGAIEAGRVPAKETADGVLVVFGGALLLTPGFVTDIVGLVCVAPPTRALLRKTLLGLATSRVGVFRWAGYGRAAASGTETVRKVRSRRVPAADRRPANVPPPPSLPPE